MPLTLPGYEVLEQIYQGSNTIIHRGRRTGDSVPVMIKTLRSEYPTPRQIASLRHEFEIIKNLNLPGVVKAYELINWDDQIALIFEDFGGQSLNSLIAAEELDLTSTLKYAIELAKILGSLHEQGIIHKDIKPHNILINRELGVVKITDFGIATKLVQENRTIASSNLIEGTLAYMSPEQTGRMNRVVDYRTDFYSLGVTLYEMLTRRLPFNSIDSMELIHSHIARVPDSPRSLVPSIPQPVSDIVMKLLAKATENRYQSANGLIADLEECLQQWQSTGKIANFPLAQHDVTGVLRLSQRLYGREEPLATLLTAFDRVSQQATNEILLVSGYSGIGKTALINEVHKPIARQRGYVIAGKFDQFHRSIPYSAIIQAFQDLIRQLLSESSERLIVWKERLEQALDGNGQVLINVIPDIELIIGPQPTPLQLGPTETRNRFNQLLLQFVRVFAKAEHPLVIFLDDLQWADQASLQLIQTLATDPDMHHLLQIGAYRDNEVSPSHPLMLMLNDLNKQGVTVSNITLGPLNTDHINEWLAHTLDQSSADTRPLAELIQSKTHGNPFFMNQFLRSLYHDQLLTFDLTQGTWHWDVDRIREAAITDNVVELMANNIRKLSPETQRILQLAACVGNTFNLRILSVINKQSPVVTAQELWEALKEGLILPLDADYRLLDSEDEQLLSDLENTDLDISYKFLHDRVQQAAYTQFDDSPTDQIHLTIGRLLLEHTSAEDLDDRIFEIVNQFNLGKELIESPEERLRLAELNLQAGQKARAAAAYAAAVSYLRTGMELLPPDHWENHYQLSVALHQERSICEYLTNNTEAAEELFDTLLQHTQSQLEKAEVYIARINLYVSLGRFNEALETGKIGLALFNINFPTEPEQIQAAVGGALGMIQQNLGGRTPAELLDAPELTDPEKRMTMRLLSQMIAPAFNVDMNLYMLIVLEMANTSLQYGNSDGTAFAYCSYGMVLSSLFNDYVQAEEFGKLALKLNERYTNTDLQYRASNIYGGFIAHWRGHLRESTEYMRQGYLDSIAVGDVSFAAFPAMGIIYHDLGAGVKLSEVLEENTIYLDFLRRTKNETSEVVLLLYQQIILNLQGKTYSRTSLSDDSFDEQKYLEVSAPLSPTALVSYYVYKAQVLFIHEEYAAALEMAQQAEQMSALLGNTYTGSELVFYAALIRAALYPTLTNEEERASMWKHMETGRDQMKIWAEHSPQNSGSRYALIAAEMARLSGDYEQAQALYDEAIELATTHQFTQNAAIANELAARFYLERGKRTFARAYLLEAYEGFVNWGATAKAELMLEKSTALLSNFVTSKSTTTHHITSRPSTSLVTMHHHAGLLDVTAVIKGAQVLAGEIVLSELVEKLMSIVVENAGAQKGLLILHRHGELHVEARIEAGQQSKAQCERTQVEMSEDLSLSIVQYVARTMETVVLHDATQDPRFANDPYIIKNQPKSLLCLPLSHQGHLTGLLYLEHNLATHAFNTDRVELLGLLSLQGAIAIENALLYADVQEMSRNLQITNEKLEESNRLLEEKVIARTNELSEMNNQLQRELIERQRAEEERAQLQQQIIRVQASALAELSTPLIPLTNRIMVMPLIGTMDSQRAQQVLENLLQGVSETRAQVVIVDITGVSVVDTAVAGTLVRAAQAVRFLGAQTIITGIRPEVAQTLVGLGVDLTNVTTLGTLQSGIAYALTQSGEGVIYQNNNTVQIKVR